MNMTMRYSMEIREKAVRMVFEHQARWVREILLENASLPEPQSMHFAVAERKAWYASQYKHTSRHTIEEEHVRYLSDLKTTLEAMVKRRREQATIARTG